MPELPEVETTLRGIQPSIKNRLIKKVTIRHSQLRWPIPKILSEKLQGNIVKNIERRGKYLLFKTKSGVMLVHLGMSGRLGLLSEYTPPKKHDHVDIEFANNKILRYTDPRRFGAILWLEGDPLKHPLLASLGVEPLEAKFSAKYLMACARGRSVPVKSLIMDNHTVVGVGNIYAAEALFSAGIYPGMAAKLLNIEQCGKLVKMIKATLRHAIKQGGTTLKDFLNSDGKPGYFSVKLKVYGRSGKPCVVCGEKLHTLRIGQRSTVYCKNCQPN